MGKKDKEKKDKKDKKKDKKKGKEKSGDAPAAAPIAPVHDATKCREHPTESLTLFCESCTKCICSICHRQGVHRDVTHSVRPIQSMYSLYIGSLTELIDSKLSVKKECITSGIDKLNGLISTARNKRLEIEIETHRDFDGILQRLKDEESRKLSILYVDLSTLRSVLTEIEDIIRCTKPSAAGPDGNAPAPSTSTTTLPQIEFVSKYHALFERASILSNKYMKSDYAQIVDCNDYPREIKGRKQMLLGYNKLLKDHELKNKFIDYLLSERKRALNEIEKQNETISDIEGATKQEMKHWMELTDRFVSSLDSFKLKCVHCGIPLHQQSVNSFCDLNVGNEEEENVMRKMNGLNLSTVDEEEQQKEFGTKGSGLHYFVPFN